MMVALPSMRDSFELVLQPVPVATPIMHQLCNIAHVRLTVSGA